MPQHKATLEIIINGYVIPERMDGHHRYVTVLKGQEYQLRVNNHCHDEILAVITVDGLSVMDGKEGDIYSSSGYIVGPNRSIDIPGWRLNNSEVAMFTFSAIKQSYAYLMSKPTNVGVIGCAFFARKIIPEEIPSGGWRGGEEIPPGGWRGGPTEQTVGTGFGRAQQHEVRNVEFLRAPEPFHTHIIYYIEETSSTTGVSVKNPFPGCQPPQGWHR